jgi:hypothetical protein
MCCFLHKLCPWGSLLSIVRCYQPALIGFWDPERKESDLMASLESFRTLGSRRRVTVMPGLSPTGVSAYAGDNCEETVHTGAGSTPPYSSDSSPYSCSTKKQRTGPSVFDLSESGRPPAGFEGPGPLYKKQKQSCLDRPGPLSKKQTSLHPQNTTQK